MILLTKKLQYVLLAVAFSLGRQASGEEDDWHARYVEAMGMYWGRESGTYACLASQRREWGWANSSFGTIGLEGVGHHAIEALPKRLTGQNHPGGQNSFPFARNWAWNKRIDGDRRSFDALRKGAPKSKYLILVRDPMDSWSSALSRFWNEKAWTLELELAQLNRSASDVVKVVDDVDCDKRFYLSFEWLQRESKDAVDALAAFLHVSSSSSSKDDLRGALTEWWRGFATPPRRTPAPPWPLPEAVDCLGKFDSLITKKLIPAAQRGAWPFGWTPPLCVQYLDQQLLRDDQRTCRHETITRFRDHLRVFVHGTLPQLLGDPFPVVVPRAPMTYCRRLLPDDDQIK